jgi:hypothetical protein
MNLEEIKEIIQREGGKIVIVENDQPQLIIMSFDEYRGKTRTGTRGSPDRDHLDLSTPPRKLADVEPKINSYSPPRAEGDQAEGLTIDDLPL